MGEAKRRGNREQRQQQAVLRDAARHLEREAALCKARAEAAEARAQRIAALPEKERPAAIEAERRRGKSRMTTLLAVAMLAAIPASAYLAEPPPRLKRLEDDNHGRG
jgi:hypothetical protein